MNDINEHYQKPDTIDSPIYDKPNAYDELDIVYDRPHEKDEQTKQPSAAIETVVQLAVGHNKRPVSPVQENESDETIPKVDGGVVHKNDSSTSISTSGSSSRSSQSHSDSFVTASVLSQAPSATTEATVNDELASPLSYMSLRRTYTPSLTNLSPSTSTSSRDSNMQQLILNSLDSTKSSKKKKKKGTENMLIYEIRKHALGKPHMHDIYMYGSKTLAYRKDQPHSYSWGFQNILYRGEDDDKVAETRRRAFQKDVIIEVGGQEQEMVNKSKSHLMFVYETTFDGFWLRWRRPSLLSHDMTCEVAPVEEPPADGQRRRRNWKLLAEFDSHRMGYLIHLGRLAINQTAVALFESPDQIEAHLLISCCTLVDLLREVVEKAVGLGDGGIAGSS
ncbi:hypothetical protein BJV82DRAFT_614354 [Fennellomyces sp. T-0311]|nr:hypothetical protein BJV82DRAFT_614354 [Fennellomyces sp. T-0311]